VLTDQSALTTWLRRRVRDVMEPVPVVADVNEPPVALAARLAAAGVADAVLVDGTGRALGLVEAAELLPRLGPGAAPAGPLGRRAIVAAEAPLIETLTSMRTTGRERVAVADAAGRPAGLLRLSAALAAGYGPLLSDLERAVRSGGGALSAEEARAGQVALAEAMLADGRAVAEVQAVFAALNDHVAARLTAEAVAALAADGWSEPPVGFTVIQMGSVGRGESLLGPDQDNGFILADYPDERHDAIDRWFIALAERLVRDLDRAGYPLCDGNVMATNPLWRKSLRQWQDQIAYWSRARSNQAILQADIFFDFRPVYGPVELAQALRRHVTAIVRDARPFLAQMCWRQREQGPPLGLFGQLPGGGLDVKLWASLPLVELVRILALAEGVEATGTRARLDALAAAGRLASDLHETLVEDLAFLAELRLRRQLADLHAGRRPSNLVTPRTLSPLERERLERLLRDVDRLRRKVLGELLGAAT
jgi:CBS domain-containing protein